MTLMFDIVGIVSWCRFELVKIQHPWYENPKLAPVNGATTEALETVEQKLMEVAAELKKQLDIRQNKTNLQKATQDAFGMIHEENIEDMIELLKMVILALPPRQSEMFEVQECLPGFLAWNKSWKEAYTNDSKKDNLSLDAVSNVHNYTHRL